MSMVRHCTDSKSPFTRALSNNKPNQPSLSHGVEKSEPVSLGSVFLATYDVHVRTLARYALYGYVYIRKARPTQRKKVWLR